MANAQARFYSNPLLRNDTKPRAWRHWPANLGWSSGQNQRQPLSQFQDTVYISVSILRGCPLSSGSPLKLIICNYASYLDRTPLTHSSLSKLYTSIPPTWSPTGSGTRPGPAQPRNPQAWTPLEYGFPSLISTHTLTQTGARLSELRLRQDATM